MKSVFFFFLKRLKVANGYPPCSILQHPPFPYVPYQSGRPNLTPPPPCRISVCLDRFLTASLRKALHLDFTSDDSLNLFTAQSPINKTGILRRFVKSLKTHRDANAPSQILNMLRRRNWCYRLNCMLASTPTGLPQDQRIFTFPRNNAGSGTGPQNQKREQIALRQPNANV